MRHERPHFLLCQDHRQALWLFRARDVIHPRQFLMQHLTVEKQQRTQCLLLRRRRHVLIHGQMGQKRLYLQRTYVIWMLFVMKEDKTLKPINVGPLGTDAIMLQADDIANLVQKFCCCVMVSPCMIRGILMWCLRPFARWDLNRLLQSQRSAYAGYRDIDAMIRSQKRGNMLSHFWALLLSYMS